MGFSYGVRNFHKTLFAWNLVWSLFQNMEIDGLERWEVVVGSEKWQQFGDLIWRFSSGTEGGVKRRDNGIGVGSNDGWSWNQEFCIGIRKWILSKRLGDVLNQEVCMRVFGQEMDFGSCDWCWLLHVIWFDPEVRLDGLASYPWCIPNLFPVFLG